MSLEWGGLWYDTRAFKWGHHLKIYRPRWMCNTLAMFIKKLVIHISTSSRATIPRMSHCKTVKQKTPELPGSSGSPTSHKGAMFICHLERNKIRDERMSHEKTSFLPWNPPSDRHITPHTVMRERSSYRHTRCVSAATDERCKQKKGCLSKRKKCSECHDKSQWIRT